MGALWAMLVAGFKAFTAACGLGEKVVQEVHDNNQQAAGAAKANNATNESTIETLDRVSKPITDDERQRVWNAYQSSKT